MHLKITVIPHIHEDGYFKKMENEKCWRGCGETGTLCTVGEKVK